MTITLKKIILLSILFLMTACNIENTKPESEPESQSSLEELVELRQNAEAAYQNNDWNKVIEYNGSLIQKIPKDAVPWFRLGNAYARLNQPGNALQAYQRALNLDPTNSKIWHNMGIVQLKLATKTFVEMQEYTLADDPLSIRATQFVDGISRLLNQDFSKASTD